MNTFLIIFCLFIFFTLLAHILGPKPRFQELPGPFDWLFGVGATIGAILIVFGL